MKISSLHRVSSGVSLLALGLLSAGLSRGSVSACDPGPSALSSFGAQSTGSGCYETDKSFTNFSVVNEGSNGSESTATVQIAGSNNYSASSTPWNVTQTLSPTSAWSITGKQGANLEASVNMLVDSSGAFISTGTNTEYPIPDPSGSFFIGSVSLGSIIGQAGTSSVAKKDQIVITETFCIGTAACNVGNLITLSASILDGSSSASTFTCVAGASSNASCGSASSASPIQVAFTTNVTTLNLSEDYNLVVYTNGSGPGSTDTLNSFSTVFGEFEAGQTPEPATFVLLGSGLAGIGLLRRYRGKKA